jgi:probable rRNA maturation factor
MIDVQNDRGFAVDVNRLATAARVVLQQHDQSDAGLTIVLTTDEAVTDLNREFRDVDAPTDVLSFPAELLAVPDEPVYLGDVLIAYPYAAAQAEREQHGVTESLMLLAIHGTLHLLGYDHDTPARRADMWTAQDRALSVLQLPLEIVPALEAYESND